MDRKKEFRFFIKCNINIKFNEDVLLIYFMLILRKFFLEDVDVESECCSFLERFFSKNLS